MSERASSRPNAEVCIGSQIEIHSKYLSGGFKHFLFSTGQHPQNGMAKTEKAGGSCLQPKYCSAYYLTWPSFYAGLL